MLVGLLTWSRYCPSVCLAQNDCLVRWSQRLSTRDLKVTGYTGWQFCVVQTLVWRPYALLLCAVQLRCHSATLSAVVINAVIITTTTTMILFTSHVFLAGSGVTVLVIQAFILSAGVLLRVCAVLQYMLDAQLFLRPLWSTHILRPQRGLHVEPLSDSHQDRESLSGTERHSLFIMSADIWLRCLVPYARWSTLSSASVRTLQWPQRQL
jgi:hypothetical protein